MRIRGIHIILMALVVHLGAWAQQDTTSVVGAKGQRDTTSVLNEVVVSSFSAEQRVKMQTIGVERISMKEMGRMPVLFGERDVMRSIQLLPGVKAEGDGLCGYQVRGGTSAQNLVLLDGATIYNSGHMMGLFSAFNDEALAGATLYKGQVSAKYGGATSSVMDIATKSGGTEGWHYGGTVGLLAAKVHAEGNIGERVSVMVAGRRSYMDLFLKASDKYRDNTMNFYDLNARVTYRPTTKDNISLSVYNSRDNMGVADLMDMHWGNVAVTGAWRHYKRENLTTATALSYSTYTNDMGIEMSQQTITLNGHNRLATLVHEVSYEPVEEHKMSLGVQSQWQQVRSADWRYNLHRERDQHGAWDNSVWASDSWTVTPRLNVEAGVRLNIYTAMKGERHTYVHPEPRLSARWSLTEESSLKMGYARTTQAIHALRNGSASLPFDRYTVSTATIRPEVGDQVSMGYMRVFAQGAWDVSAEMYYKKTRNVYDYRDGKTFSSAVDISDIILGGKGRAYGLELCGRKNTGRLTGWASYTLSWAENKIDGINGGRWYTASHDRRHDVNIVVNYVVNKRWNIASTFLYNTGQAMSAPSAKYQIDGNTVFYYAERNGYLAPAYHRLDVSVTNTKRLKRFERQVAFGVFNLYNRHNPYVIHFSEDRTKASGMKCTQTSMFGLVPFVSVTISH